MNKRHLIFKQKQGYIYEYMPGHPRAVDGYVLQHLLVCEKVLGHLLPPNVRIHHIDDNKTNNVTDNLVICEGVAYHTQLHMRRNAYRACGNANFRLCKFCQIYDDPNLMYRCDNTKGGASYVHQDCNRKNALAYYYRKKPSKVP